MELIDSHAHIDFPQFDEDRVQMLERARAAGVTTLLAVGTGPGPEKLDAAMPFAEASDWIYTSVGIHPHEAKAATAEHFAQLAQLARHRKVIAWGEIGLDYHYDFSPRDVQERVFREQLRLAAEASLPVIIHCREAWPDCIAILEKDWRTTGLGGIFHCFSGTREEAQRGLEMGFYVSFAANITYPKAQNLRDSAKAVPMNRLLIETDSPYLAPQAFRGKRNEPAYLVEVARMLASVRDLRTEDVAVATAGNFRRLFRIEAAPAGPGMAAAGEKNATTIG